MSKSRLENLSDRKKFVSYVYATTICANVVYLLFKISEGESSKIWTNVFFSIGAAISLILIQSLNRVYLSKVFFLTISHAMIYLAAIVGPQSAAIGVYFIVLILVSNCLFELAEWRTTLIFNICSIALCVISSFNNLNIPYGPQYSQDLITLNYVSAGLFAMLVFLYQNFLQSRVQQKMAENNKQILNDSREIKKTNLELDKFVYSVSHDIRAPLASIAGLVNVARFSKSETDLREIINRIGLSAASLLKTTGDIVDYSRTNRLEMVLKNIYLRTVLEEIQHDINFAHPDSNVVVSCNFDEKFTLNVDYPRFRIILSALYSNSVKYRDRSKQHSFIRVEVFKTSEFVTLTFADNGIGILPDRLSSVFNMFYRATDDSGSGLGLYILKHSVEKLGGAVCVASEPGEGTIFKLVLPVVPMPYKVEEILDA